MVNPAASLLAQLTSLDTPTVCNALELVAPDRRGYGFTTQPLVCTRPELPSVVGVARTATIRATHPDDSTGDHAYARDAYYEYIGAGPKPSVIVIQDLDAEPGYGSFWGEVNSNIHKGLGCAAVITNGSVRDLPDIADGFQMLAGRVGPSHAFVHVVDFGRPVTVAGMRVSDGDLIHADQHGAVVVPNEVAGGVQAAAELIVRRERVVIEATQKPGFDIDALRRAQEAAARVE
ncbi:MAG: RraA family protein [Acidimicrobiia bacterium]|nr:RraA family protein [Acidimicrobiia bacterium]